MINLQHRLMAKIVASPHSNYNSKEEYTPGMDVMPTSLADFFHPWSGFLLRWRYTVPSAPRPAAIFGVVERSSGKNRWHGFRNSEDQFISEFA
jgi:hypothetical protein